MTHDPSDDDQRSAGPGTGARGRHDDDASTAASDRVPASTYRVDHADTSRVGAGRQLDPVGDAVESVEPDVIDAAAQEVVRELRTVRSWRGPLPPASELAAYDQVLPGAAERILRMSEKALDEQIEVDTTLAHGDVTSLRRGQWQSTAVVHTNNKTAS